MCCYLTIKSYWLYFQSMSLTHHFSPSLQQLSPYSSHYALSLGQLTVPPNSVSPHHPQQSILQGAMRVIFLKSVCPTISLISYSPPNPHMHIHTQFKTLQWLPIVHRIRTKVLTMACQALHDPSPAYLFFLILPHLFHHVQPHWVSLPVEHASSVPTTRPLHWLHFCLQCFSFRLLHEGILLIQVPTIISSSERPSLSAMASPYHFTPFCLLHSTCQLQKLHYLLICSLLLTQERNSLRARTLNCLVHCYVPTAVCTVLSWVLTF